MQVSETIKNALEYKTTTAYVWLLACIILFASHVHIANMLGWNGRPWYEFPFLWKLMDVLLLVFDIVIALGLIYRKVIAVIGFVTGIFLLQVVPFTVFRAHFVTRPPDEQILNVLLGVEITLVAILVLLISLQGREPVKTDEIQPE